jgi:hypothetical protein
MRASVWRHLTTATRLPLPRATQFRSLATSSTHAGGTGEAAGVSPAGPGVAAPAPTATAGRWGVLDPVLRADVKLLGTMVGDWVKQREGEEALDTVERIRLLSKRWRTEGDLGAFKQLVDVVDALPPSEVLIAHRSLWHAGPLWGGWSHRPTGTNHCFSGSCHVPLAVPAACR